MNQRIKQREETRKKIVNAAIQTFSDHGFTAASTREIADLAGVNQGLLTYHFQNKELLWREAANRIFDELDANLAAVAVRFEAADLRVRILEATKAYVRFTANRPELLRFMVEEGKHPGERMEWLVDTHLKPMYERFVEAWNLDKTSGPHVFYILVGGASTIFAIAPECERLTGMKPTTKRAIDRHAEIIANLLVSQLLIR